MFCQYNSPNPCANNVVPVDHYENFPVASWLLPSRLRQPIESIYAFARTADDFADEGDVSAAERLANLDQYARQLDEIAAGQIPSSRLFRALAETIQTHQLPIGLFHDLLDAFKQDVTKTRYASFEELMDYCRRSADPIGRLLLHLYGLTSPRNLAWSDSVCSSLQLINHWQDVAVDWKKNESGRVYLPQEDLRRFGLSEVDIAAGSVSRAWREMMAFQCQRARSMMHAGRPLGRVLPGRLGLELRAIMAGGLAILDKIDAVDGDVFRRRPRLRKWDWLLMAPRIAFSA